MATEAEIPESVISITKREGEIIHSATGQFDSTVDGASIGELNKLQEVLNVPPESVAYLAETKSTQAVNDVGAEAMNTVIKVNVETPKGENFFESSSAVPVVIEDTCRISKNSEPDQVTLQAGNEMLESDKQVEVTGEKRAETSKEYKSPEQKGDGSFMKHEGTLSANELLAAKEASSGENRYEEESSVTATKDNIADTEIIDTFDHKKSDTSNRGERPENWQQNEQGKVNLEESLNVVPGNFYIAAETITSVEEETPMKIEEKSFEEEVKQDFPYHTEANVSVIELNEKTECGEVEVPNENVNDFHVTHALVEQAGQNEGKNLVEIFNSEPEGKIQEAYEAYAKVEKQIEDAPEPCPSANSTIFEQTSVEGSETTELMPKANETDIEKLQEASGPDFEEKTVVDDWENTDQKVQKNGEACGTATQEILANRTDAGQCVIDAEASDDVKKAVAREEKVDQNIQVESPLEEAPELPGQDERCIAEDNNNRNNIINEEEHNGTKVAATVVRINEQVIEDNVESCEGNKIVAKNLEGNNNREQVTEDSNIRYLLPESVEQAPINDLKNEKKVEEESTEEIWENSDTAEAAESITHEIIKTIESPKDIDFSTVQQGESQQTEERNLTLIETSPEEIRNEVTSPAVLVEEIGCDSEPVAAEDSIEMKIAESEEDLIHIAQRNEPGEELPQSLSMLSDKEEVFNSDAKKTPGNVEEGSTQNLEESLQKEENEKETEVKSDTEYSKTAMELYPDSSGGQDEETEKHNMKEECGTTNILAESIGEESLQSSKEEKVDQFTELEEERIESSQGDESKQGNDTYISPVLIEQETIENYEGNKNKAENTEGENDREKMIEETNSRGLVPESVEQSPVKNLQVDKTKEDESTGEIAKNSKNSEVAESAAHATSQTFGSTTEILDTSLVKQGESLENEEKKLTATESSAEERRNKYGCLVMVAEENSNDYELLGAKDNTEKEPSICEQDLQHTLQEKEPEEKNERAISALSNEIEAISSNADRTHCLMEKGTSQDFDEVLQKEDNDKETEEKNDTKDNNITAENHEIVAESSDASKITDKGMVLEPKLEKARMLAQDEIKKEESEELCENSRNADESESEKHNTLEGCSTTNILSEDTEEKTQQSFEEERKEEETPKTEVYLELEIISVGEDAAEKQNEEGTSQLLDEAPQKEDNDKETEERNGTENNKIPMEESIEKVGESSDASKGTESSVLEPKSEKDKMLAQDQIKNEEFIELYEDSKNASKSESDKHNTLEESGTTNILPEPTEDKTHQNFEEEEKQEETLKTEACLELETTCVAEAAEKQTAEGENTLEQSRELEVEKVEKSSKENDMAAKAYKEEECEITHIANSDDEGRHNIEKGGAEENEFEPLARETDNEDSLVKLNDEKEHDNQIQSKWSLSRDFMAFKAESLSTSIEKRDIVQVELLKDQVENEIVEENSKVADSNSFTKETKATSLTEETVSETLKDGAESNVNSYPLDVTKESEAETPTIETSGGLFEESDTVSHMSNIETGKEIEEKDETTINYSDSASITVVTEEKGLQEAEPEVKKQIACPVFEEKSVAEIETKETALETADVSVNSEDTSDLGEKRDNDIPTGAKKTGETNQGLIEEFAMVSHTLNKESKEEIPGKGETTIEDSDSEPITVVTEAKGLLEDEAEDKDHVESVGPAFGERGIAEIEVTILESVDKNVEPEVTSELGGNEIPIVADTDTESNEGLIKESAGVSHASNKETEEEIKEKEETCIEDSDSASTTVVSESKGQQQTEPEDRKRVERVGHAFEEKGVTDTETKETTLESVDINMSLVDTTDLSEKRDDENPTVADKGSETNGCPTAEYATVSHASCEETEEKIEQKKEISIEDSDSASMIVVTEEKGLQEAEPQDNKLVENVVHASEEKGIPEIETKETTLENVDISVKPEDSTYLDKRENENSIVADNEIPAVTDKVGQTIEGLIEESAMVSRTQDKENEEEIKEREVTTIDDSNSASITAVTEARGSQEAELEDKKQVESVDPAFEEKGTAETKTKHGTLESVDINVKAEDKSDLGEKRDKEIPNVADADRETMDCETQNDVPGGGSEDQTEVTSTEKFLQEISKDDKLTTADVNERVNETPAQVHAPFENAESTSIDKAKDAMSMNKQDTISNSVNVSELESVNAGKETGIEEVQKQMVEIENAENFSKSEDEEISKVEERRKLADQGNVYKSTTLKVVESLNLGLQMEKTEGDKPLDQTLKTFETSGEHTEGEKAILEEEFSAGKLKELEMESAEVEPEGEAHFQRHGDVNNTDNGTAAEEKLECTSEAVAENQTSETLPESDKSQMEEYSSDNQIQEHDNEIREKEQSQFEAEEHEEQNASETTKAILTEKEREGVEQSDDSEGIKELIVEEERGINEFHAPSTLDETTFEMENSTPVSSEYDRAVGSKEETKAENSEIEEESARETQASSARESEEQKSLDVNIEPDLKESKEKIGDTVEESSDGYSKIDDAILTAKTETSSGEAKLGDKHEKGFHVAATEAENSQQVTEVDNVKLEGTSELAAELALNYNCPAQRESTIVESKDVSEPRETNIASEAVSEFNDLTAEEAIVGKSQTVENPDQFLTNNDDNAGRENAALENSDADEAKIISIAVDKNKDMGAEDIAEAVEGSITVNIDQIPTSDSEHTQKETVVVEIPKADEVNKIKLVSNDTYESNYQETEESSGKISTVENEDVGEPEETKITSKDVFESKVQGAEEAEVGESQRVETPDQKPTNNDDNTERKNAAMENSCADEAETEIVADEIKAVSNTIYESKGQGAEEAEVGESLTVQKPDQVPTDEDHLAERKNETMENSGVDKVEQIITVSDAVDEAKDQCTGETAETGKSPTLEKMDPLPTSNCKQAQKESVAMENSNAVEVTEIKMVSDATYESNYHDTEGYAEEIPTVEKLNQTSAAKSEQVEEDRVIMQYQVEVKDQITEDTDEAGKNSTEHNPDGHKIGEASKAASDIEPVTVNEVIADQIPSVEKLNVQLPTPTSTLPFKDETTATVEKIEEEKPQVEKLEDEVLEDSSVSKPTESTCLQTGSRELEVSTPRFNINKEVPDSLTEVYEEEGQNCDEDLKLEPPENENKIKCADSSSETDWRMAYTEVTRSTEKPCVLESETSEKALQSEVISLIKTTESEDTEIKDRHLEVISDVRTEEIQLNKICELNETVENEVSKEQITEEKEVAETCQPFSPSEEKLSKSLQVDGGLKDEECRGDETKDPFKTSVNGTQYEEPSVETEKATASTNVREQVDVEDTGVDDSDQISVEKKTIKENLSHEFEGKNVEDSAIKLGTENLGEENNLESGKTEATIPRDEESSMEMSKKENIKQFAKEGELIQETWESKEGSCEITKMQIPTQAELLEHPDTTVQIDNEYDPPVWLERITESPQKAQAGDLKPGNAEGLHSEEEVKHEGEQTTACSGEETKEGTLFVDSTKASLSDHFQRSRKETTQVAKHVNEETEPTAITEENQTVKPETIQVKESKMNEEKEEEDGDEHKRTDSSASDAPVMVEASKDLDVKVVHKKSHNILSGVGSKVKHSISKVKKAITGKSSRSK